MLALLVACAPEEQSTDVAESTTSTDDGTSESTTAERSPSDFLPPVDLGTGESFECNQWTQDCPAGQKCMPYSNDGGNAWNATRCSPIAARPAGIDQPCGMLGGPFSGLDDCDFGLMCWDVNHETLTGRCIPMCAGAASNPLCETPDSHCVQSGSGVPNPCLPKCDPLAQDCREGNKCVLTFDGTFLCVPALGDEGEIDTPCGFGSCAAGLVCVSDEWQPCPEDSVACCRPICEVGTTGPPCPVLEECVPWEWFPDGEVPPGLEDVGYCALPDL